LTKTAKMKPLVFICLSATLFSVTLFAQQNKKKTSTTGVIEVAKIKQMAYADSARLVDMFKDIHANPELPFMELRTAGIVAKELKSLGFDVQEGIGKTGVVGMLKNGEGPIVMYRADMDCNSVQESTSLPYKSTKTQKKADGVEVPVMHACGHDAHTTWMLGVAKIMVALKDKWKGTLIMVGQPAEENGEGAEAMVKDGLYNKGIPEPDFLFGMHTAPFPVGVISNGPGPRMAGCDQLDVTFYGIGGHGSSPHLAKDPIVMAAAAIMQYQVIVSRAIDPQNAAVLTVGSVQSGIDNNVIPGSALLKLNLRWFKESDRDLMIKGINQVDSSIAIAYNLPKDLYPKTTLKGMAYPLVNNEELSKKINNALAQIIPLERNITNLPAVMGSEDFHHLVIHNSKKVYDYMLVGIANPAVFAVAAKEGKQFPFSNHNSNFEIDLSAIPLGTVLGATGLLEIFRK
jgi:amidohydrolase